MTAARSPFADAVAEALAQSFFGKFPPKLIARLMTDAIRIDVPAGSTLYHEHDEPRCSLVVFGLIRIFLTTSDGRDVTVRYARTGDVLGVAAIVGGPAQVSVQMLADSTLLKFNAQTVETLAKTEPRIGWLIAQEVTKHFYNSLDVIAGSPLGTVRQRAARFLLEAATLQQGQTLVAPVTQQELADAVDSTRPVIARILRELRQEGIIGTAPAGILVISPTRLHAIARSPDL